MNRDIDNELYAVWLAKEVKDLNKINTSKLEIGSSKKLPASCFIWVGDRSKRNTWHLPYRCGAGDIVQGRYENAGAVSVATLKAVSKAISASYPGAPHIPHQIKTKIKKLLKQYNINDYSEAKMNEKQDFNMVESLVSGQFTENQIDTQTRIVSNVAIMRQSTPNIYIPGSKGTAFSENFRRQVALMLAGAKAYADHSSPWKKEDTGGVRSVRDLVGYYENGNVDAAGIVRGDLHYLSSVAEWFEPLIEEMADKIGLSIDASGTMQYNAETEMADAIDCTCLKSVDLVTEPGSTVNIFESKQEENVEQEDNAMDLKQITIAELKESRPDLITVIEESATKDLSLEGKITTLETQITELTESNKALKGKLDDYEVAEKLAEKEKAVNTMIEESKIPAEGITEVFRTQLVEAKDDEARKALIDDRKALIENKKVTPKKDEGVTGMGDENVDTEVIQEAADVTAEFKDAVEG